MSDGCGYQGYEFGAGYLDSQCFGGWLQDMDSDYDSRESDYKPCPQCRQVEAMDYYRDQLRIPVADVPNFCGDNPGSDGEWCRAAIAWLAPLGFGLLYLRPGEWMTELPGLVVIAGGRGPRGCDHCVLMRDGKLIHDPHPDGTGLVEVQDVTLIVLLDGVTDDRRAISARGKGTER